MDINPKKIFSSALLGIIMTLPFAQSALSYGGYSNNGYPYGGYSYYPYSRPGVFTTHPILTGALLGGAVGAVGGVAVGAMNKEHGSMAVDTAIGAGGGAAIGAGIGMIRNRAVNGYYF